MAKYSEMTEEQREKVREYKKRYNKKNPEKVKEWRERHALKHLEGIKKAKLKSFFKFYNLYKNKEQMFTTNDISIKLKIGKLYATEIATQAKQENLITPIGRQSNNSIMYHFNKERIENMNNIKTEPTS
jgi:hypothetical protein